MTAEDYTKQCKQEAAVIVERIKRLASLMRDHGDNVRAMDLDEAVGYVEASIEEV